VALEKAELSRQIGAVWRVFSRGASRCLSPAALGYFQRTSPTRGRFDRLRIWDWPLLQADATDLFREDIDKDDLWDITENNRLWRDNNSDGLQTTAERTFNSSPFTWQPTTSDTDDDDLTDIQEQSLGTKIDNPDSDGDLLPDGWEVTYGLTLLDEYRYNTNPNHANTDGDTQNDGTEVNQNSAPKNQMPYLKPGVHRQPSTGFRQISFPEDWRLHLRHC